MNNEYQNPEAAEYMNNYYTNAGPNIAKKMTSDWKRSDNLSTISVFEFGFIPEACVQRLLSDIEMSKSSIVDSLSTRILKDAFSILSVELRIYIIFVSKQISYLGLGA